MKRALPLLALLAACRAGGPASPLPVAPAPESWSEPLSGISAVPLESWWTAFADPRLDALIERALFANHDLEAARARVLEARSLERAAGGALRPEVGAGLGRSRSRTSLDARGGAPLFGARENDLFEAGFDAHWELDLFGGLRSARDATRAEREGAEAALAAAQVTLVGEVVRTYVELAGLDQRIAVARDQIASQEASAEVVTSRVRGGVASELDQVRAEALVAYSRAVVPGLESARSARLHRLAVLLGAPPRALDGELGQVLDTPIAAGSLELGLPSELVRRRPDLVAAERACAAAGARAAQAAADLYPRLSLDGSLGWLSNDVDDLFESSSQASSLGAFVHLPIFDRDRLRAFVAVAEAREAQAVAHYLGLSLLALEEVENALASWKSAGLRSAELAEAVRLQSRAAELAEALYRGGLTDYLTVLDTQRQLFASRDQAVEVESQLALAFVALAKALGGGAVPLVDSSTTPR